MSNYMSILNAHAIGVLAQSPAIPDYHLMVGSAECLSPLPLLVYQQTAIPTEIAENMKKYDEMSNDDIMTAIANNQLEVNDMNGNIALIGLEGII